MILKLDATLNCCPLNDLQSVTLVKGWAITLQTTSPRESVLQFLPCVLKDAVFLPCVLKELWKDAAEVLCLQRILLGLHWLSTDW